MTERTITVTFASIATLALLAWANPTIFLTVLLTSLAWCVLVWAVFIRNPKRKAKP